MELIDKQELLDWIQNCWDWATVDGITSTTVLKQTMTDISQLPTVEAIPKDNVYKAIQEMMKYEHEGFINISLARLDEILKKCGVEDGKID